MQIGRFELLTDVPEVTYENIIPILQEVFPLHQSNASRIEYLINYDGGIQPLQRTKEYRPDIDIITNDNVANEVTEFNVGFKWSQSINLVQRGEKDSGKENESLSISMLNELYEIENVRAKTQRLGRFVEIGGIGYTYVDVNMDYEDGESFFKVESLDPRNTFVVRSNYYIDKRIMIAVTYRTDSKGNHYFTCFTKDTRFEIINLLKITNGNKIEDKEQWYHDLRSGEENPLHRIPIVEWFRSYDRLGSFERQIPEMDALNIAVADFFNDVDQNTQAIFHTNDIDFPKDENGEEKHPKTNDWVSTFTSPDGKTPFIKPIAIDYDYAGMLKNISYRRNMILQKCNIPVRNDNSGGSTGIAMDSATGWNAAETAASSQQNIMESCKMEEVKIVLKAIQISPYVPQDSPLLKLKPSDVQPSIKRSKNYEMSVKTSALANLLSHGIYGLHALKTINLFDDVSQVWTDSKEIIERYQSSIFDKNTGTEEKIQTTDGGAEAQIENSPLIDGMSKEKPIKETE